MTWVKFNQTAYSSEREYYLYHCNAGLQGPCFWHIVFWPEKGNGKPTVIGMLIEDLSQKEALVWADSVVEKHKANHANIWSVTEK